MTANDSPALERPIEGHHLSRKAIVATFAALMVAMFVASLNQTVISTALPTIVMPLYGKLGDLFGRKYLFCACQTLFVAGSLICACASSIGWLIAGRAIQGLGGGGQMILSQAIVADIFPPRERGKYMGIMGASFGVSMALGPLIGGAFTEYLFWRWCFLINVPLGIAALVVAAVFLPHRDAHQKFSMGKVDITGFACMAVSVTCLILAFSLGGNVYEWGSPETIGLLIAFALFAVIFLVVERRAAEPLISLSFFKNRNFAFCTIAGMAIMVAMAGVISYLPTYFQIVDGLEATPAGYMTLPMMVGMMVTSTVSGFVAARAKSVKWMPLLSCAVAAAALVGLSSITVDTSLWQMGCMLFVLGFGIGIGQQILVLIVQNEFSVKVVGSATAANNFFREIGATVGGSLVGSLFSASLMDKLARYADDGLAGMDTNALTSAIVRGLDDATRLGVQSAYNDALAPVFGWLVPLLIVAFVLLLFLKSRALKDAND